MTEKYTKKGFTELSFFDNGISIPGSFSNFKIHYESDSDAIDKAVNGFSTKDEFKHRGWGINTIVKIFTEGIKGEIFIASRNGAIYINKDQSLLYDLGDKYKLKGTLFSIRIPKGSVNINVHI